MQVLPSRLFVSTRAEGRMGGGGAEWKCVEMKGKGLGCFEGVEEVNQRIAVGKGEVCVLSIRSLPSSSRITFSSDIPR